MLWWLQGSAMDHKGGFNAFEKGYDTKSVEIATGID